MASKRTEPSASLYAFLWAAGTGAALLAWPGLLKNLFVSDGFMPHGGCYLWLPSLVRLHVASDVVIGLSYAGISACLIWFVARARRETPFQWIFAAFGLFILSCGATHFLEAWTVWHPQYWLAGGAKLATAAISAATALALPFAVPRALRLVESARLSEQRRRDLEKAVAELKRAQEELAGKNADLLASNRELETFNYLVAHDLRAPLRAIDGFTQALADRLGPALGEDDRSLMERVRRNARRMGRLIDDLLAFARLGQRELMPIPVDMGALARSVFEEIKSAQSSPAATLTLRDLPPARGDLPMLRQAVASLLSNAVKFSARKPAAAVEVGGRVEGAECVYYVKDNGEGFDMKYAPKLFKVFQRLHGPEEFEGSGVGLAIVSRVVARHRGRVWADARPGEGATFYFTLPRSP